MARKVTFKGIDIEELKTYTPEQAMSLIPSRSRRALKRAQKNINYKYNDFLAKVEEAKKNGKKIKTHTRAAVVLPSWIGMTIGVYDGRKYVDVVIMPDMIGHRLGEYAGTTIVSVKHSGPGIGATRGSKFMPLK